MRQFNLETQAWEGEEDEPLTSLKYLQSVYRDENRPDSMRIRCAVEALPYENPRVSAVAVTHMDGQDFASALERAIERSNGPVLLNSPKTIEPLPASEMKKPFPRPNYRRF
jgi:hypothetical protein